MLQNVGLLLGIWVGKDLYGVIFDTSRDLGLLGLIKGSAPLNLLLLQASGTKELF